MSPLRRAAALLAVIAILTCVAAMPRPQDASDEIDNAIPQKSESLATSTAAPSKVHITRAPPIAASPNGFSRFINDVFQIPISVLKAVSSFLSNTFGSGQKS